MWTGKLTVSKRGVGGSSDRYSPISAIDAVTILLPACRCTDCKHEICVRNGHTFPRVVKPETTPPARQMKRLFLVIRDSEYTSLHQLVIQEYLDVLVQWDLIHQDTVSSMDKIRPEHCRGKESSSRRRYSLSYLRDRRTFWRCFRLRAFQFLHRSTEEACFGKQASSFHRRGRW